MSAQRTQLGEIIRPVKAERAGDRDLPVLSMTMHGGLVDQADKFKKRVASRDTAEYKVVNRHQLVVGFPIDEGVLSFQELYEAAIVSPAYGIWDLKQADRVDREYLERYLRSPRALAYYAAKLRSTTARRRSLPRETFLAMPVPLPPLPEQRRIAAILDKADAVRRKRQQTIDLADQFLRSAFLDLVNRNGTKLQRLQLGAVALKKRSSFVNGPFGSNLLKSELHDNGVPVIYIRDIRGGIYNRVSTVCVTDEKAAQLSACSVMSGDVLVSKVGDPPGIAAVYPREEPDAVVTQDVIRIRVDQAIALPEYLAAFLNSPLGKHRVKSITVEATRARFSLGAFKAMPVELPPIEVQERFVELLSRTRPMQARLDRLADKSAEVAASLTQRAFRGEL